MIALGVVARGRAIIAGRVALLIISGCLSSAGHPGFAFLAALSILFTPSIVPRYALDAARAARAAIEGRSR